VAGLLLLLQVAAASAQGARRQGGERSERGQAGALFRQGSELFSKGRYQTALELLERAQRLYPSHKIEVSIGYALEALGRDLEAAQSFERFLRHARSRDNPTVLAEVEGKLRRLRRSLGRLTLDQVAAGETIVLDGAEVARAPLPHPLYLRPGEHRLVVRRGERTRFEQTLALEPGEHRLVIVSEAAPAERARSAPRKTPLVRRWWLWVAIGGAVLSAAVIGSVAATTGGSDRLPTGSLGTVDMTR
jgi:tetratricopeptide (TPR) repeat protein